MEHHDHAPNGLRAGRSDSRFQRARHDLPVAEQFVPILCQERTRREESTR